MDSKMNILEPLSREMLQKIAEEAQITRLKKQVTTFCSAARELALKSAQDGNDSVTLYVSKEELTVNYEIQISLKQLFPECSIEWEINKRNVKISWA
jgi:hypothetical protein